MKSNELVWRSLADKAIGGERSWASGADLAFDAGVPLTTAYLALERLESIGAITRYARGGFSVVSLDKLTTVMCALRNLAADTITRTTHEAMDRIVTDGSTRFAIGGCQAAAVHLGGAHVADSRERILYLPSGVDWSAELPHGDDVRVVSMDSRAERRWVTYSSVAQTYIDLFATPGWAASEYRIAMREKYFPEREWDAHEEDSADG